MSLQESAIFPKFPHLNDTSLNTNSCTGKRDSERGNRRRPEKDERQRQGRRVEARCPRSRFPSLFSPFRILVPPGAPRRAIPSRPRFNARERRDGSKDDRAPPPPPPPQSLHPPRSRTDRKTRKLSRSVCQWADVRRMSYDRTKVATHHARSRRTMLRRLI